MSQKTKRQRAKEAFSASAPFYRAYGLQPRSLSEEDRTVEAVITTETPVMEWDWNLYEMVPRVLLASGAVFPPSNQIPFLDSHNRYQMENQLGSARGLAKGKGETSGTLHFSSTAERQWTLIREGHATDVSAGFQVLAETHVPSGQTQRIQGKDYTGPINVATKWRLYEVSLTPIGADEQAKLRGFSPNGVPQQDETEFEMKTKLRELCVSRGMPKDLDDEQAQDWLLEHGLVATETERSKPEEKPDGKRGSAADEGGDDRPDVEFERRMNAVLDKRDQARQQERVRLRRVGDDLCDLLSMDHLKTRIYDCPDEESMRALLKAEKAKLDKVEGVLPGAIPRVTGEGRDAFRKDMAEGFIFRSMEFASVSQATRDKMEIKPPSEIARKLANLSLTDMARECLIVDGFDVRLLTKQEIAMAVMGGPDKVGLRTDGRRDGGAYHTTGSFAYLTENAVNKSMMAGYTETPGTWRGPMRQGPSAPDFKQIRRYALGAIPNLSAWPDNKEPNEVSMSDFRESWAVEAYAEQISLSWQLVVNDDMSALTVIPLRLGAAAGRTVNAAAWAVITANAAMADTVALFSTATGNRFRANLITGAATPTVATIGSMTNLMRQMRGRNVRLPNSTTEIEGPDVINVQPVYVACPSALETTIRQLVLSGSDPATGVNPGTHNPTSTLTPIVEPLLDAASLTAWYLFASPNQVDTVEMTFLQGHEQPVMWSWMEEGTLTRRWAIRQVFAPKALDYRGMVKHAGA